MVDFTTPPDFVNAAGVKWWHEPDLTKWGLRKMPNGKRSPLPKDLRCYAIEFPDGDHIRVVTMGGAVVHESTSYEGIGVWLDMQRLILTK